MSRDRRESGMLNTPRNPAITGRHVRRDCMWPGCYAGCTLVRRWAGGAKMKKARPVRRTPGRARNLNRRFPMLPLWSSLPHNRRSHATSNAPNWLNRTGAAA